MSRIPPVSLLIGVTGAAMLAPALRAAQSGIWVEGRGFLYAGLFTLLAAAAAWILAPTRPRGDPASRELIMLLTAWAVLPVFACLPLLLLTPGIGPIAAWFEMVSAITTTGATAYATLSQIPESIHLWRGLMGWYGGLLTLMAAYVVLAPRRLGGFEIMAAAEGLSGPRPVEARVEAAPIEARTYRALRAVLPFYVGATLALAVLFSALGQSGLEASVHAMSTVATSGISPSADGVTGLGSIVSEAAILVMMVAAATRLSYGRASQTGHVSTLRQDAELRLLVTLVAIVTLLLFLRHWLGVLTIDSAYGPFDGLVAIWGAIFTTTSFLTTTGWVSFAWESARDWSGHSNPTLVLLCLCMIGGGAATTAGGIKLIRAYALFRHGARELDRIASPNAVAGSGAGPRGLRREGAFIAWTFMMLFLIALMVTVVGMTLTGMQFDKALIASVAALANTGPAFDLLTGEPGEFSRLGAAQHIFLATAMILGRIEILAFIALFARSAWASDTPKKNISGNSSTQTPL